MRLALIELVGYREWTESLGDDREWLIQAGQAQLYRELMLEAARHGGFVFPLRYDYLLVVATGLGRSVLQGLLDLARLVSRMPVKMASVPGERPRDALLEAQRLLQETPAGEQRYVDGSDGVTVLAHVDINNISASTRTLGLPASLVEIADLVGGITRLADRYGGIAQYLGGDNVLVLLPPGEAEAFAEEAVSSFNVKAGIGVAASPRRAMMLSSRALHMIREGTAPGKVHVLRES